MPQKWLQVKGEPSVREFLFQQTRVESLFDSALDRIHDIVRILLTCKEVLAPCFIEQFRDVSLEHLRPVIDAEDSVVVPGEFRRLRTTDQTVYPRNGSINRVNGMIGMAFSRDGSHSIDHRTFFEKLESFAAPAQAERMQATANT